MFNEAFWFFYWVGVVEYITVFFTAVSCVFGFIGFAGLVGWLADGMRGYKWPSIILLSVACVLVLSVIFIPTTAALYAGAGQYVGESVEVDETLLRLKELVDAKIEEQMPKE